MVDSGQIKATGSDISGYQDLMKKRNGTSILKQKRQGTSVRREPKGALMMSLPVWLRHIGKATLEIAQSPITLRLADTWSDQGDQGPRSLHTAISFVA